VQDVRVHSQTIALQASVPSLVHGATHGRYGVQVGTQSPDHPRTGQIREPHLTTASGGQVDRRRRRYIVTTPKSASLSRPRITIKVHASLHRGWVPASGLRRVACGPRGVSWLLTLDTITRPGKHATSHACQLSNDPRRYEGVQSGARLELSSAPHTPLMQEC